MSAALTSWRGDLRSQIQLAQSVANVAPRTTPTGKATADLALASYLRVCCSEFQAFCAALFDEAVDAIRDHLNQAGPTGEARVRPAMSAMLVSTVTSQTKLGSGNPNLRNLIADFDRLGVNVRKTALITAGPAADGSSPWTGSPIPWTVLWPEN